MKYTQSEIEDMMIYKFIRGSHCHGINTPTSDIDYGGVFCCPQTDLYGLSHLYEEDWHDEKNDTSYYELRKYMELLLKANPTILESLFVDDEFIIKTTPAFELIKEHRDMFVTKECFGSFYGYAKSQIHKARGLNKKIVKPVYTRKTPLDFCYTFTNNDIATDNGGGSMPFIKFMEIHQMSQEHCGLVNIPNMHNMYAVYYDADGSKNYAGIIGENSNELRLQSTLKGDIPVCYMSYNAEGYSKHCKDYNEYKQWEQHRNPVRYESNLNKNYDAKNMCECFRLLNMGIEIAEGRGVMVNRRNIDGEMLLRIKRHEFEYDELIEMTENLVERMNTAVANSTLPEKVDINFVNNLLVETRKLLYI